MVSVRALAKDLENQQGTVSDRHVQVALEIALLGRAQRLVEQHFLGAMHLREHADFIGLAAADKQGRIGHLALAGQAGYGLEARGLGQQAKLFELAVKMGKSEVHADQEDGRGLDMGGVRRTHGALLSERDSRTHGFGLGGAIKRLRVRCPQAFRPWRNSRRGQEQWWKWRVCTPFG